MENGGLFVRESDIKYSVANNIKDDQKQDNRSLPEYHVTKFRVQNFKAFRDSDWISLNRITLVLGDNSAGKSALFQVLQMLKVCYERLMQEDIFQDTSTLREQFGGYSDMCREQSEDSYITFQFVLESENAAQTIIYSLKIESVGIFDVGHIKEVTVEMEGKIYNVLDYYISQNIFFLRKKQGEHNKEVEQIVKMALHAMRTFSSKFRFMSAHRYIPLRQMMVSGNAEKNIGEEGQNIYQILYMLSQVSSSQNETIQNWLAEFGYRYQWNMIAKNQGEFLLKNLKTGTCTNIVDNGFGISQSLPVVLAASSLRGGSLLIDSPEAFLQTRMQAELADVFIEGSGDGCLILETSSEYLTIRMQRRVAEQKISANEISIYFIKEKDNRESVIEFIELTDEGVFYQTSKEFMEFFSENYNDIIARDEARKRRLIKGE